MVVLPPPPIATTEDWLSGAAPRQYTHPEKRAALERAGCHMLEVLYDEGQHHRNIKWQLPSGTTVTRGGVAALLKEVLSPGPELDRLLQLKGSNRGGDKLSL